MIPHEPIIAFALPAILAAGFAGIIRPLARRSGFVAVARDDRFHVGTVPVLGGVAVVFACCLGLLLCRAFLSSVSAIGPTTRLERAFLIGFLSFLILGLIDDRKHLAPSAKGLCQGIVLAAVLVVWRPGGALGPVPAVVIAWVAGMLLLNAWNYLDHADGVFATAGAIGAVVLALLMRSLPDLGILQLFLWAVAGGLVGFLAWNLPPARIFLGDAGALPIGFALFFASVVVLDGGIRGSVPGALAPHALALTDFLLVTIARLASGRHPFVGDRGHTAHRLTGAFGSWNALAVVLLYAFLAGFGALLLGRRWPLIAAIVLPVVSLAAAIVLIRLPPPPAPKAGRKRPSRGGASAS